MPLLRNYQGGANAARQSTGGLLAAAAMLSTVGAALHMLVVPEHFEEWWGYGTFFLITALAQGFGGIALWRWPGHPLFLIGIAGNLAIVGLWLTTRSVGVPFFGPHAWEIEGIGAVDLACTLSEIVLIFTLSVLLRGLGRIREVDAA
ncbi:MAG TPA: hypothetical protein VHM16_04335 [Rubrobacteraceae bacterium]|nr:hypothetical protein [Rubrobacteraceae bacterium]